jgi:hypothetical protein
MAIAEELQEGQHMETGEHQEVVDRAFLERAAPQ